jgi:hypothetical protein
MKELQIRRWEEMSSFYLMEPVMGMLAAESSALPAALCPPSAGRAVVDQVTQDALPSA